MKPYKRPQAVISGDSSLMRGFFLAPQAIAQTVVTVMQTKTASRAPVDGAGSGVEVGGDALESSRARLSPPHGCG